MPNSAMTKFVSGTSLYLREPDNAKLEAVIAWMADRQLTIEACLEGTAIFTPSGRGKSVPMVCIDFKSAIDPKAYATMAELYPAPKSLKGIVISQVEVTDEATDMPIAPAQSDELAEHFGRVAADATAHAEAAIASTYADVQDGLSDKPLGTGTAHAAEDSMLAQARHAIAVGGPMPSVMANRAPQPAKADDVPF